MFNTLTKALCEILSTIQVISSFFVFNKPLEIPSCIPLFSQCCVVCVCVCCVCVRVLCVCCVVLCVCVYKYYMKFKMVQLSLLLMCIQASFALVLLLKVLLIHLYLNFFKIALTLLP